MNSAPKPRPTMATLIFSLLPSADTGTPANGVANEPVADRWPPDAFVVAVSRVEHATLAVRAHPRPRLTPAVGDPFHQHEAIGVVHGVHVGLVPDLKWQDAFEHRMVGLDDRRGEFAGAVFLELRADE